MFITTKMQNAKQRQSSLEAENRFSSNYAFRTEHRSKMSIKRLPRNEYCQNIITSFYVMKNV